MKRLSTLLVVLWLSIGPALAQWVSGGFSLGGGLSSPVQVVDGGTGATSATNARSNLSAAKSGSNSDITALTGLTGASTVTLGSDVVGLTIKGHGTATVPYFKVTDVNDNIKLQVRSSTGQTYCALIGCEADLEMVGGDLTYDSSGKGIRFARGATLLDSGTNAATLTGTLSLSNALGVASGGTGRATLTANSLLYGDGTNAVGMLAMGTALQMVRVNAGGTALEYFTPTYAASGANSDITSLSALSTAITVAQGGTSSTYGAGLVSAPTSTSINGVTTLTSSSGPVIYLDLSTNYAVTLPVASTCAGKILTFISSTGNGVATLTRQSSDSIGASGSATTMSFGGQAGTTLLVISDGTSRWIPLTMPFMTTPQATASSILHFSGAGVVRSNANFTINTSGQVTAGAWQGTAIGTAYGGTGNANGAGLLSDGTAATDTSGTVALSATSASLRTFNNGASALTYTLPQASTCPGKVFLFSSTGTSSGDLTITPNAADYIGQGSIGSDYTHTAVIQPKEVIGIISNGVGAWLWLIFPNKVDPTINGIVQGGTSTPYLAVSDTPTSSLTQANSLTSATSLTAVGALATGSIAAGFGNISNTGSITASTTVTATLGDITATNGNYVCSATGKTLSVKSGSNACAGSGTLSGGTATVSTTAVTANSRIFVTDTTAANPIAVTTKTASTSFVVTGTGTDTFDWFIVENP